MAMEAKDIISLSIEGVSACIALVMAGLAIKSLRELVVQAKAAVTDNAISRLDALLNLENTIAERRRHLAQAGLALTRSAAAEDDHAAKQRVLKLEYDEAEQIYLNALDRLCHSIKKGVLIEEEMRPEYRDIIKRALDDFPGQFNANTPFRNVRYIYERWAEN